MCAADALLDDDGEDADEEALALEDEAEPDDPDDQPADDNDDVDEVLGDTSEDEPEDPRDVSAALAKVRLPNGSSIGFYRDGRFEAVCRHVNHLPKGRCRLTRTSYGTGTGDDTCPAQGRPLGLLASWCLAADDYTLREDHCDAFAIYSQTLENRIFAREELKHVDGAAALFAAERALRVGETEEPEEWP